MGLWPSVQERENDRVVSVLDEQSILHGDAKTVEMLVRDLKDLGYAVIKLQEQSKSALKIYESSCEDFFKLDEVEKLKYSGKHQDKLLDEIGPKPNIGYIRTKGKEYIKLRGSDIEALDNYVPQNPPNFKENFKSASALLSDIADACLLHVGSFQLSAEGNTYIKPDVLSSARSLARDGSSVSSIRYFQQKSDAVVDLQLETKAPLDEENEAEDGLRLKEHADTGLLTLIRCARIPGLQIEDRSSGEYFTVDSKYEPESHLFCIVGRKLQLVAATEKVFQPTLHRVMFDPLKERFSLLYFMDFRK